jgi:NADPH2 dehydrogenase
MSESILFSPLNLRDVRLANRIVVAPMGQYSAENGSATDWHLMHLGQFAVNGAGLLITEATAVSPQARITPDCLGLYSDENERALARVVRFCRRHSAMTLGIQLSHSGRKGSTHPPASGRNAPLPVQQGGWQTLSAAGQPRAPGWPVPRTASEEDLTDIIACHVEAARRAQRIGFDLIELTAAHGYLLQEFMSPAANTRSDRWGGSFENRTRLCVEVFKAIREVWPEGKPIGVRLSATDYRDDGWKLEETVALCSVLKGLGCDFATISSGGLSLEQQVPIGEGHQVEFAARVRRETGLPVMAVGMIVRPEHAESIVASGDADMVAIARGMLQDPHWPCGRRPPSGRRWSIRRSTFVVIVRDGIVSIGDSMVRLSDMTPQDAQHLLAKACPRFDTEPFVSGPPLPQRRVAIVTTAGLHRRGQSNFELRDTGYRVIPGRLSAPELAMSHSSVNFDRSGFQQDINTVFPVDRLRTLEADGEIGSVAEFHYSLMGAGWEPHEIEDTAREVAGLLKEDSVNAALLVPV